MAIFNTPTLGTFDEHELPGARHFTIPLVLLIFFGISASSVQVWYQNDSLTSRWLPDMSRMSPSPRWTSRASSSARSSWWSMGAGWSSFSSRGYCWQHQTCTRVFKTIFFCLDYFLCQEVCLDINQTDLQDWGCFDWCLNQSHQSITCCSPASWTWPGLTDASPQCWCSPAGRKWGNYSISKILFWK